MQWDLQVQLLYKTVSSDSLQSQLHISNGRVIKADLDLWNQIIHKESLDGSEDTFLCLSLTVKFNGASSAPLARVVRALALSGFSHESSTNITNISSDKVASQPWGRTLQDCDILVVIKVCKTLLMVIHLKANWMRIFFGQKRETMSRN